jgi:nicotinate-nucleotide pyrophosphorylase (carboxylating)
VIQLPHDFQQLTWSAALEEAALPLIRLALNEDLGGQRDWSTWVSVPPTLNAQAKIVCRASGVACGLKLLPMIQAEMTPWAAQAIAADAAAETTGRWRLCASDGDRVEPGTVLARWDGAASDLLTMERTVLNFLGRLSGIATQHDILWMRSPARAPRSTTLAKPHPGGDCWKNTRFAAEAGETTDSVSTARSC